MAGGGGEVCTDVRVGDDVVRTYEHNGEDERPVARRDAREVAADGHGHGGFIITNTTKCSWS